MIVEKVVIAVPVSVAAGAGSDVSKLGEKTVFLDTVFVGTYQLQLSGDGTNYENEGAALTAPGSIFVQKPCMFMRWNCTAYTSGAPVSTADGIANMQANW